ncbi:MAG TPA: Wzz/FepE/Etk N-terminal domain-containing protein [Polyangia bacterium]|jgi:uncharacterized protein involved in exopolysaccharide biosynthesis|nr:Wzz/FepE/Etk N-terminal domain-containing protein [Polyangia bacterium]
MASDDERSPRDYVVAAGAFLWRVWRSKRVGALIFLVGLGVTGVVVFFARRQYKSETVIFYDRGVRAGTVAGSSEPESPHQVSQRVGEMLTSRSRLEKMINDFKLYPETVNEHGLVEAVDEMKRYLKFSARDGYTYNIAFTADSREAAQHVLATLAKSVVEEDTASRRREADAAKKFLDVEKARADEELRKRETALGSFLAVHPQLAAESATAATAGGSIRAADRAASSGGDVVALELQASQLEEMITSGSSARQATAAVAAAVDPGIVGAKARAEAAAIAARKDLAEKRAMFTDEHPDVKNAQRHLADAEADLRRASAGLAAATATLPPPAPVGADSPMPASDDSAAVGQRSSSLRRALAAVRAQIAAVRNRSSSPKNEPAKTVQGVVAVDTEWTRLSRDVAEARERNDQLESRQFQASLLATLASTGEAGRLVIVEPAFRPMRPVAGRRVTYAGVGAAGSLAVALIVMIMMALFDERVYSEGDIRRIIIDPFVVVVPPLRTSDAGRQLPPMSKTASKKDG